MNLGITRDMSLIHTLMRYPATVDMLLKASKAWDEPIHSRVRAYAIIRRLYKKGYIGRQELPVIGYGRSPLLYFVQPKAKQICPDLATLLEVESKHNVATLFRATSETSPHHAIATSSLCAELERSIGERKKRLQLLRALRATQFKAPVIIKAVDGESKTMLIPDYTYLIDDQGKLKLYFIEIQHQCPLTIPLTRKSVTRSFKHKLTRYKVLSQSYRNHPIIQNFEHTFSRKIEEFSVLIVTTRRTEQHLQNLLAANHANRFIKLFYFARLETLAEKNIFTNRVWRRSDDKVVSLLPDQ